MNDVLSTARRYPWFWGALGLIGCQYPVESAGPCERDDVFCPAPKCCLPSRGGRVVRDRAGHVPPLDVTFPDGAPLEWFRGRCRHARLDLNGRNHRGNCGPPSGWSRRVSAAAA